MTAQDQQSRAELPGCPFCGGRSLLDSNGVMFRVFCSDCGAKSKGFDNWAQAEAAWSRRAPAAQERKPLTDERIRQVDDETHFHEAPDWPVRFARAIEAAQGIK